MRTSLQDHPLPALMPEPLPELLPGPPLNPVDRVWGQYGEMAWRRGIMPDGRLRGDVEAMRAAKTALKKHPVCRWKPGQEPKRKPKPKPKPKRVPAPAPAPAVVVVPAVPPWVPAQGGVKCEDPEDSKEAEEPVKVVASTQLKHAHRQARELGVDLIECQVHGPNCDGGVLCLDHDHDTGEPRWVLCFAANAGMGQMGDDLDAMEFAGLSIEEQCGAPRGFVPVLCDDGHERRVVDCRACWRQRSREETGYNRSAKEKGWTRETCMVTGSTERNVIHHWRGDPTSEARLVIARPINLALGFFREIPMEMVRVARLLKEIGPGNFGNNYVAESHTGQNWCAPCGKWVCRWGFSSHKKEVGHQVRAFCDID